MTRDHPRYAPQLINGDPDVTGYAERRKRGYSILVRVRHVGPATGLGLKPASTAPLDGSAGAPHRLSGGGDGFTSAKVDVPVTSGPGPMELWARSERGTAAHEMTVAVEPFETRTAFPVPAVPGGPRDRVVVDAAGVLVSGDALTLSRENDDGTVTTQTSQVQSVIGPHTVDVTSDYTEDFPLGATVTVQSHFDITVLRGQEEEPAERHRNLSGTAGDARAYHDVLDAAQSVLCAPGPSGPIVPEATVLPLSGGRDPGDIHVSLYTGYDAAGTPLPDPPGLATLEAVGEVCVVAIPDLHRVAEADYVTGQAHLLHHCERNGSRFALLDPPPVRFDDAADPAAEDLRRIEAWPRHFRAGSSAKNGALYYPWVTGSFEGRLGSVPPCGYVAGHIADSDRRRGVGKAPANARLHGVVDLAVDVNHDQQGRLNPLGVNCIRKFEDGQVRLHGARTLSGDPRWTFVNVRRVMLSIIKTVSHRLLWTVFEPNDARLRERIMSSLMALGNSLVAGGVTASADPAQAFYVKCNEETNPPGAVDAGRLFAEIGVAVAKPAEFIVVAVRRSPDALSIVVEDV